MNPIRDAQPNIPDDGEWRSGGRTGDAQGNPVGGRDDESEGRARERASVPASAGGAVDVPAALCWLGDTLDEGLVAFDATWRYTYVNAVGASLLGHASEAIVGRTPHEVFPDVAEPMDGPGWVELRRVMATRVAEVFDSHLPAWGRWFENRAYPAPDGGVLHFFRDVTARKHAEAERERLLAAVERAHARLSEVFQRAPSFAAAYRGPEHRYEFVNEAYYGLVGYRPVLGRPLDEAIPEAREQGFTALLDQVLATGEPLDFRETPVWLERTPGAPLELRHVDMVFQPLREADGTCSGVLAHGVDVTAYVHARQEVERLLVAEREARAEAEAATLQLQDQAMELEAANAALQERALELEATAEELQDTAAQLEEQVEARDAALQAVRASEARHRALVEASGGGIWRTDADGGALNLPAVWAAISGQSLDDAVGLGFLDALHPDDRDVTATAWLAAVQRARAGDWEVVYDHEYRVRRHDGVYRRVRDRGVPVRDESGAVVEWVGTVTDVEDARAIEEALRRSEARYALAARATRHAIWEWEYATDAVAWNEGAAGVLGHEASALGDLGWWAAHVHPDDRQRVLDGLQTVREDPAGAVEWGAEYRFRRADGTYMEVEARAYVVRDEDGRAHRMVGAVADVTATRALEERLRQAQKMEAVGQLAGGIAHDFNNLLTVISGNLEFLRSDLPPALSSEHPALGDLEQIEDASARAQALVRQLLTFSRRQPVRPRRVQIGAVVEGSEKLLRRVIGEEISLAVHADDGPWQVEADPGQLEQVLMNLAVNARDAMLTPLHGHAGRGGALTVEVDMVRLAPSDFRPWEGVTPGAWVRLRVHDTGHGMDAATQAHIFEPFFTTKDVGSGTGLGLATVFGIVRQASGVVRVTSAPGQGTTFTLLFPALEPAEVDAVAPRAAPTPMRAATVLLVEDETAVRATARRMLERHGYTVLEARHGGDALLIWRQHREGIDVVVTDLRMPELGGRELLALLRAERPDLPAVLLSGYADQETLAGAASHGSFVPKPFSANSLLTAVAAVLDAGRE